MQIIKNMLLEHEIKFLLEEIENFSWILEGYSVEFLVPKFWHKDLSKSKFKNCFQDKISKSVKKEIKIDDIYCNGQAFGQCGFWHRDVRYENEKKFTLVYFYQNWLPEYGGHFMIKMNEEVVSVLPEYNKAILFNSYCLHMALGASRHCPTQRESLAVKFTVF
jgi:hypothetical protein